MSTGLAQSIHTRLVRHAAALGVDANLVLARYAAERLLYRLSRSRHADRFVLKGALLLLAWLGETIRPTRDVDLLGFGDVSSGALAATFRDLCDVDVEPDGLTFDATSILVAAIRAEDEYGGQRVTLLARLGTARLRVQVDIGVGDAVSPDPEWLTYPSMLDLPRPRLRAYRPATTVAEKVHAMVLLGARNSRMRDFFDVHALAARQPFEGEELAGAMRVTFERRRTPVPTVVPLALTPGFAAVEGKEEQWRGFIRKSRIANAPALAVVIESVTPFAAPALSAAGANRPFPFRWPPGGPWERAL